jgi:hypothetical protein
MDVFKIAFRMIVKHIVDSYFSAKAGDISDAGRSAVFALLLSIATTYGLIVRGLNLIFRFLDRQSRKSLRCYPEY